MPIFDTHADVPDGGASSGIDLQLPVSGVLENVTVEAQSDVAPTLIIISLFNQGTSKGILLKEGYAWKATTARGVEWTGRFKIPRDYQYFVNVLVKNLTGASELWAMSLILEDMEKKHDRFIR